jgi:pimeloyl-ACP methyl ester carboxylesterase
MQHLLGELGTLSIESRTYGDTALELTRFGAGRPLLFLHGEDGLMWSTPVIRELSTNFEVIVPHHPGWDGSAVQRHITETSDLARLYAEFLEEFSEPVVVLGCSFGAWVGAELAVLRPPNLAALALVAPIGVKVGGREDRDFADIWTANFGDLPGLLYGDPVHAPSLNDRPDSDYLYLSIAQEATARFCWRPYMHSGKLRYWLRRVNVPCAVIAGDSDRFALAPNYFDQYASMIGSSGAQLNMVAGAGHRVEEEAPGEVAKAAIELLSATAYPAQIRSTQSR